MDLPVAPQSYQPSPEVLVRAILRGDVEQARLAAQETPLADAVAFTNPRRPHVYMLNFADGLADVAAPPDAAAALGRIHQHFQEQGVQCWSLRCTAPAWPAAWARAATEGGYVCQKEPIYLLQHYRRPQRLREQLQVIPTRAALAEAHRLRTRTAMARHHVPPAVAGELADTHADFLDDPRLESFLGRSDGQPVGIVEVLSLGDLGVVATLDVDPDHRRQRIGTTLLAHALDYCARAQFSHVLLLTNYDNPAIGLYEKLGFVYATELVTYVLAETMSPPARRNPD